MTSAGEVVREVVRRFGTGEPIDQYFAPEYRTASNGPSNMVGVPASGTPDEQMAHLAASGTGITVRSVTDAPNDRFILESVWVHRQGAGGSAGIFWSVLTVENGLICAEEHFQQREKAYAYAGLTSPGSASPATDPQTPGQPAA